MESTDLSPHRPGKVTDRDREALLRLQTAARELDRLLSGSGPLVKRLSQRDAPQLYHIDTLYPSKSWYGGVGGSINVWVELINDSLPGLLADLELALALSA